MAVSLSTVLVATTMAAYLMGPVRGNVVTDGLDSASTHNVIVVDEVRNPLGDEEAIESQDLSGASAEVFFK